MSKKLTALFFCVALVIIGSIIFLRSMTIDYSTLMQALKVAVPGSIVMGYFGYLMGKVLESAKGSKSRSKRAREQFSIDDLLKTSKDSSSLFEKDLDSLNVNFNEKEQAL